MAYPYLFSPLDIGPVTVKNRIFVSAHHNNFDTHGLWTDRSVKYYEARAEGGAGMIVTGAIRVHPMDPGFIQWPRSDWAFAPGQVDMFRKGVDAVHAHDTVFIAQLAHGGRQFWDSREDLQPLVAPSAIPCPVIAEVPKELEPEDLDEIVEAFARAAAIADDGGFDGIEVHSAYGYLLASFITPTVNQRDDEYGGSLENRMRFPIRVLEAVRSVIGPDKVLGVRMIGDEYIEGGLSPEDAPAIGRAFADTGLIDYISVTGGTYASGVIFDPPMYVEAGYEVPLAARVKDAVELPVLTAGRLKDPTMADGIIATGQADMVAMTRATICDPDLPRKAQEGREEEIRWCIGCNQRCIGNLPHHLPIGCFQNPASGREFDPFWSKLEPPRRRKTVAVVGAGPGGCEAACVLAERGHRVILLDRADQIGGQVRVIEMASGRNEWQDVYRYHENRLPALDVDVRLGVDVDRAVLDEIGPDAVVVATGSTARVEPWEYLPRFEGLDRAVDVRSVLSGDADVGHRVVVYAGDNHIQGLTTADTLLDRGHEVSVVVPSEAPGALAEEHTLFVLLTRLTAKGLAGMHTMSAVTHFTDDAVGIVEMMSGHEETLACDTLVSSFGGAPADGLYKAIKGAYAEVHRIGDCVAPRNADAAIFEGSKLARVI